MEKKDDTIHTITDEQGKRKNVVFKEEHVSVISQPGGDYVTHLTPPGGKGVEIANDLAKLLHAHNLVETTEVVGCDSSAVNTGNQNGVLAVLERIFGRRLLWQICQLHLNELPLRHAFCKIDGETDSKNTFKGVIGKMLPNVEDMELKLTFLAIDPGDAMLDLPESEIDDLSSDQHMLYLAWISVRTGKLRAELLSLTPGPVSHSRWLTLALRILLLHMTDHKLKVLVSFLVSNYIPMWFTIKKLGKAHHSSQVLFKQIQLANQLKGPIAAIVKQNVARNAYAAQSETLLLCMVCDTDPIPRAVAVDKILKLRNGSDAGDTSVRQFDIPAIQFDCDIYHEMIDWSKEDIYEPVLTSSLSIRELENIRIEALTIPDYPNHAQGCERQVKETSRAAALVAGFEARDGYIRASAVSRKMMKKFETKKDFANNVL